MFTNITINLNLYILISPDKYVNAIILWSNIRFIYFQFDIRLYVLVTSLEPLRLYLYDDGLIRIATEEYTEDPQTLNDSCIHVCNYAINSKNTEKFIYNENPSECEGNKVPWHETLNESANFEFYKYTYRYTFINLCIHFSLVETQVFLEVSTRRMWSSVRRNGKFMGRDESGCDKNTFDLTQRYLMFQLIPFSM